MDDWKQELFWCFVGSVMGTVFTELVEKLKEKVSRRSGKALQETVRQEARVVLPPALSTIIAKWRKQ